MAVCPAIVINFSARHLSVYGPIGLEYGLTTYQLHCFSSYCNSRVDFAAVFKKEGCLKIVPVRPTILTFQKSLPQASSCA